jgi:transcription elongation GreA/GreB family factor
MIFGGRFCFMDKKILLQRIIKMLESDLALLNRAAKAAHEAATHAECIPDNKYDTTALEASYIAQGQANRASDIRVAVDEYRRMVLQTFDEDTPVRLSALVTLEDDDGGLRRFFLGPDGGGLKVEDGGELIMVITPWSPLGRALLGMVVGDEVRINVEGEERLFSIVDVC